MRTDPSRFYGTGTGLPLGVGMLVRDCVIAQPHSTETRYETGLGLALILTHECDIDENNERYFNDLILVCPVIPLDIFCEACDEEEGSGSWGGILPHIAGDNVFRAMYLPPVRDCEEMEGGGIIYLNHMSSCRVQWMSNDAGKVICSLSALGLRAFDAKLQNHLLRPKALDLWFTR